MKDNHLDHIVTLLEGKVEELTLPVEKVDIIISEWMGYFLLYEGMMDTVLYARDKWLAPDGLMFPDKAVLFLTAIEDEQYRREKYEWWNNVYGFDMSSIGRVALAEPLVACADGKAVVTDACAVLRLDMQTCVKTDWHFSSPFRLYCHRDDRVDALLGYFDIFFSHGKETVSFSTSPFSPYTHWKQTVFYFDQCFNVRRGEEITGSISVNPNAQNFRDLDIAISYAYKDRKFAESKSKKFFMK